ncbi:MAG: c-type cytochrome [Deltaproteobacteria bacterium]|nr:c-type cytochrome [Candidatus Zymogenaceae bacterium]
MESRRLMIYVIVLMLILVGMLVYIFIQTRNINEAVRGDGPGLQEMKPDLVNGGSIYEKGADLKGKMIPISGGPAWFITKDGGCAACHGQDGLGEKPIEGLSVTAPNIRKAVKGTITGMSAEEFTGLVKWGERPNGKELSHEMPHFDVPEAEVVDLMEYIKHM